MAEATPPSMDRIFINLGDSSMSMFLINYLEKRQRLEEEHCPVEAELDREWNHRPGKCTLNPPPNLPTCHIYRPYHHLLGSSKLSRRQICLKKCTNKSKQPQNAGVAENGKICGKMLYWQSRPRDADDTADPLNDDPIPQTLHVAQDTIFRVYCTVINKDMTMLSRKRQLNILDKVDKSTFLSVLWSCATIVFDISTYPDQLEQIDFVIRSLMEELTKLEGERKLGQIGIRRIILVSPSMTWALTQTIDMDDTDSALIEEYYNKRKPDPEYIFHYQIENRLLALANRFNGQIKVLIISSGCVYGHGEHLLDTLFGEIWSSSLKEIPICGTGENRIPVIYDADLARIIFHFVINFPQGIKYIFAMEKESPTQLELVKAIMSNLSKRRVKIYSSHASMFSKLKPELNRVLESNLNLRPHFLTKVLDWDTSMRITRDLPSVVEEFKKRCNLKPLRIILLGPDTFGKRLIAKNLCKYYNITYISPASLALQYIRQLVGKKENKVQNMSDPWIST